MTITLWIRSSEVHELYTFLQNPIKEKHTITFYEHGNIQTNLISFPLNQVNLTYNEYVSLKDWYTEE